MGAAVILLPICYTINGQLTVNGPKIGIPQPFPLTAPLTKIEIVSEPTATLKLTVETKCGGRLKGQRFILTPM